MSCEADVFADEECSGAVEYRITAIFIDGEPGDSFVSCGDSEHVYQAIAFLIAHGGPGVDCAAVREWAQ